MKIHVKQSHINGGIKTNCDACPIALAICEVMPFMWVSGCTAVSCRRIYDLPRSAQRFIKRFDAGKKVKPFNFILR